MKRAIFALIALSLTACTATVDSGPIDAEGSGGQLPAFRSPAEPSSPPDPPTACINCGQAYDGALGLFCESSVKPAQDLVGCQQDHCFDICGMGGPWSPRSTPCQACIDTSCPTERDACAATLCAAPPGECGTCSDVMYVRPGYCGPFCNDSVPIITELQECAAGPCGTECEQAHWPHVGHECKSCLLDKCPSQYDACRAD